MCKRGNEHVYIVFYKPLLIFFKQHVATVNRLSSQAQAGKLLESPKKVRPHKKTITELSSSTQAAIRDVIYDMYKQSKFLNNFMKDVSSDVVIK